MYKKLAQKLDIYICIRINLFKTNCVNKIPHHHNHHHTYNLSYAFKQKNIQVRLIISMVGSDPNILHQAVYIKNEVDVTNKWL